MTWFAFGLSDLLVVHTCEGGYPFHNTHEWRSLDLCYCRVMTSIEFSEYVVSFAHECCKINPMKWFEQATAVHQEYFASSIVNLEPCTSGLWRISCPCTQVAGYLGNLWPVGWLSRGLVNNPTIQYYAYIGLVSLRGGLDCIAFFHLAWCWVLGWTVSPTIL